MFLPGWTDISTVHDMLKKNPFFSSGSTMILFVMLLNCNYLLTARTYSSHVCLLFLFLCFRQVSYLASPFTDANC